MLSRAGPLGGVESVHATAMVIAQTILIAVDGALCAWRFAPTMDRVSGTAALARQKARRPRAPLWDLRFTLATLVMAGFGRRGIESARSSSSAQHHGVTRVMTRRSRWRPQGDLPLAHEGCWASSCS
jgi:ABC-type tungstate transport system substrate-binding protein